MMAFSVRQTMNLFKMLAGIRAPVYVQLALSKACTMRCRICNAVESRRRERELDLGELARLSDVLRAMRVGIIILSGGEPLLRPDIADIVSLFRSRGLTVRIQSNGMLFTEQRLRRLRDAGLDGMTISLHSLSDEKMAYVTGVDDALQKIFNALSLYSRVFPSAAHMHGINTVVSAYNIEETPAIVEFAGRIGYVISLIPVHLSADPAFIVRNDDSAFRFTPQHDATIDRIYGRLESMKREGYLIYNSRRFLRECPDFLKTGKITWKCESPDLYFSISPSGIFLPCVDLAGDQSMLAEDFLHIWRSRPFRKSIRRRAAQCRGCMYACYPEFSYMLHSKAFYLRQMFEYRKMVSAQMKLLTPEALRALAAGIRAS